MSKPTEKIIDQYRLSARGQSQYSKLTVSCFRTFLFWLFVGNCAGFTLGKFLPIIKKSIPPLKLKRYQFISLNLCVLLFGWYGYKIASYERKIGRTNIVKDALNIEDVEVRIVEQTQL